MIFAAFAGLAAGFAHVLAGPDHLAAVAPLVVNRTALPALSERRESKGSERSESKGGAQWRTGFQWGLGHTAGVVSIGLLLLTFRAVLPVDAISAYSERLVGVALLAVGIWALVRARHPHTHAHTGGSGRASFAMGTLHGFAGSSHLFGILPALALPTHADALIYLTAFGIGAIAAMTAFAGLVSMLAARAGRRGLVTHRAVLYACSFSAFVVGSFWLVS